MPANIFAQKARYLRKNLSEATDYLLDAFMKEDDISNKVMIIIAMRNYSEKSERVYNFLENVILTTAERKIRDTTIDVMDYKFPDQSFHYILKLVNNIDGELRDYYLVDLLQNSEFFLERINIIKAIYHLRLSSTLILDTLENVIVSDADWEVKTQALKCYSMYQPKNVEQLITWVSDNEIQFNVMSETLDFLENNNEKLYHFLKNAVIERISRDLGIIKEEALFFSEYFKVDGFCIRMPRGSVEEVLNRFADYSVKNNRVIALELEICNELLPYSITNLSELKVLIANCGFDRKISEALNNLKNLTEIHILYGAWLREIPQIVIDVARNHMSKKYIKIGVNPDEATSLALLDIFLMEEKMSLRPELEYKGHPPFYGFDVDDKGSITSIIIDPDGKEYLPEPIMNGLKENNKNLRTLCLKRCDLSDPY